MRSVCAGFGSAKRAEAGIVPRKEINIMMNAGDIAFPHLGIYLENVPRSFSVFGFEIAFYG